MTIKNPWLLFLGLALGPFMVGIDLMAMSVAIEPMTKSLGIDIATLQWFVTAYAIGNASFQASAGKIADLVGRRQVFFSSLLLFVLTSLSIALSSLPVLIIVARLIQGASGGALVAVGIAIIMTIYAPNERTKWISLLVGAAGLGMVLGPIVGGVLIHYFSWRMVFLINIPIGFMAMLMSYIYIPKVNQTFNSKEKIDWIGMVLFTTICILFTIGISQGQYWGWFSVKTFGIFLVTLLLLIAFIILEKKIAYSLIEFELFKVNNFLIANCAGFVGQFMMTAWIVIFGIYLQRVAGMTAVEAGLSFLPFGIVLALVSTQLGRLSKRFSHKRLIVAGNVFGMLAFLGFSLLGIWPHYWVLAFLFALYGLSFVIINSCCIPAALEFIPVEKAGISSAISTMIRWLGGALGSAIIATIFITHSLLYMENKSASFGLVSQKKVLHDVITGKKSLSALQSSFSDTVLQKAHQLVDASYHHGLVISVVVLAALAFLTMIATQIWMHEREE